MNLPLLVLAVGIVAASLSFVFIRESVEPPVMLAAWRVLLSALLLLPVYLAARKRHGDAAPGDILRRSLLPGCVLSAHFITWVMGVRLTTGANATLIVNLVPLVLPFLMLAMFGERPVRREVFATLLAMIGLVLLAIADLRLDSEYLAGDALCLLSMLLFAVYLALARTQRQLPSVWLYLVPMYAVAGVATVTLAPLFGPVIPTLSAYNLMQVFLLAAVSTVIGHSALNFAMQRLRGQTVSILNLFQFVVAALVAWALYDEQPPPLFYPASALVISAVLIAILSRRQPVTIDTPSAAPPAECRRHRPRRRGLRRPG